MDITVKWEVDCRSDLVYAGKNEFGETLTKEVFYLVLENERGDRYASTRTALNEWDLDALRTNVQKALNSGATPVGSAKWYRTRPCYGSRAYVEYGAAEEIEAERRESNF